VEVAALGAAIMIMLQLTVNYWLYPYIVWFYPLVIVALFTSYPDRRARSEEAAQSLPARPPEPIPIQIAT
jgi:hypothetical protein